MSELPDTERIAIIGMAGRFPKANDLDEYWRNLRDGVDCISFAQDSAADAPDDATLIPAGGVLEGMDLFDAPFFSMSPRDAEAMDPQQRVFLECAWHSLEAAGYNPETCDALIGVFAGAGLNSYMTDVYASSRALAALDDFQIAIGNDKDHLTTQVAYKLNLRGPCVTVQTACSTSLVAVCTACQSLLNYQCDIALAGGVAVDVNTRFGYYYQRGGILSPDGHCRAFDAAAAGTVPGDGVGIVVLKRLSEAQVDGDHIRAVIPGFALNNDGYRKVGYTAPSVDGQAEVIAMAHASADVDPGTISYLEAHGTGTALGDPIEIAALNQAFGKRRPEQGYCAIGSVKSNIGHLDTAAGVAGLIKTVLALEHRRIPPSLHFVTPNPEIDFASGPFQVATELTEWSSNGGPRRAGVSSFGIGGTNAHVVVEEAPIAKAPEDRRRFSLVTISARSATALETATDNLSDHLREHPDLDLADVAYTYHLGRKPFAHRRFVIADTAAEAASAALESRDSRCVRSRRCRSGERSVFFLFPGQGTQRVNMGVDLYRAEPCFRAQIDRCAEILRGLLKLDVRELLYPHADEQLGAARALDQTAYTQPALFAVEYALAQLWTDWGVRPAAMLGHSIGEWVAACLAGVVPLETALELVTVRGRVMDQMPPGAMLAVSLSQTAVEEYLADGVALAAVNGSDSCVLAGPSNVIDRTEATLTQKGCQSHRLSTSHAFHSSMMEPAVREFVAAAQQVPLRPPEVPFISNVTGTWIASHEAIDPLYWGRQLRETVRFADGLHELLGSPDAALLEVGPGHTLANLVRQQPARDPRQPVLSSLPSPHAAETELESLLGTLGELWLHGVAPDWERFHAHENCGRVALPGYPFERRSYWIESSTEDEEYDPGTSEWAPDEEGEEYSYPAWKPAPPCSAETPRAPARWLVLGDAASLTSHLAQSLRQAGHTVVQVISGERFSVIDAGTFAVSPGRWTDYVELLTETKKRVGSVDAIAHLWSAVPASDDPLDRRAFAQQQELGFSSLVALAQGLERAGVTDPLELNVITSGVHAVIGNEPLCPARATLTGACRVIAQEYAHIACRVVDVDQGWDPTGNVPVAQSLLAELTEETFEPLVAYRNARRWLQTFDPAYLDPPGEQPRRTRRGGAYLITGGLGNIGFVLAGWFALTTAEVKLVLTGRTPLPDRSEWDGFLADPDTPTARRIGRLLELERAGAEVAYFAVDVADAPEMSRALAEAERRFGPIRGVVHGAGDVEAYFPLNELDREAIERQFRPKVYGLMTLDEVLRGRNLDFCVVLSSLSAIVGGVGLAGYSAANCFLDAMATRRNQAAGPPWISINWGGWHFPAADDGDNVQTGDEPGITPQRGAEAFEVILARAPRQVIVSHQDLSELYEQAVTHQGTTEPAEEHQALGAAHGRPDLSTVYVPPRSAAEARVAEIWQTLLGLAPIGVFDNFFELGGHSLLAIQLISRLRLAFDADVSVRRAFELPTIAELAKSFEDEEHRPDPDDEGADGLAAPSTNGAGATPVEQSGHSQETRA